MEEPSNNGDPHSGRRLTCWISAYLEFTKHRKSPEIFRKWSAISAIAGALRRHSYIEIELSPVYPNMFIVLVGPPASGKGRAIEPAKDFLRQTKAHIAPNMTTKEDLIFRLGRPVNDEKVPGWMDVDPPRPDEFPYVHCTVSVMSEELGNFLQEKDNLFQNVLIDLYDCLKVFQKFTKTSGVDNINNVALNLLGGTTPDSLSRILPEAAFQQGFASRLIMVYSKEEIIKSLFGGDRTEHTAGEILLSADMASIGAIEGEFVFEKQAAKDFNDWYMSGMRPRPTHPRLATYNGRRHIHLAKLLMIFSASRRSDRIIDMEVLRDATMTLLEAEQSMEGVLHAMGEFAQGFQIHEAAIFLTRLTAKTKLPTPESQLRAFLLSRVPVHQVRAVIDEMILSDWIKPLGDGRVGTRVFFPGPKAQELQPQTTGEVEPPIRVVPSQGE